MAKVELYNPNLYTVTVIGPGGKQISVRSKRKVIVEEHVARGINPKKLKILRIIPNSDSNRETENRDNPKPGTVQSIRKLNRPTVRQNVSKNYVKQVRQVKQIRDIPQSRKQIVGKAVAKGSAATENFKKTIREEFVPVSNNIAIGILSYNRVASLQRTLESIKKYTDTSRVTVFVSDDGSNPKVKEWLKQLDWIVLLDNKNNLGIACNSNRLLKCMDRFKWCFLLNDDVEIMGAGWEHLYVNAHKATGVHHFCYRQSGLFGATRTEGNTRSINGYTIQTIENKPHGAMMFYTNDAYKKVGFFEESWGRYGMEHVDWSNRVGLSGLQSPGFFDVVGSEKFIKIHNEKSASETKHNLNVVRDKYKKVKNDKSRIHIKTTTVVVPSITYVIPVRDIGRTDSIKTVIKNIKGQRFPHIEIILSEEDTSEKIKIDDMLPMKHLFIRGTGHFNKSKAFNRGVELASNEKIILHDGDILAGFGYTSYVNKLLDNHEAAHIGLNVLYFTNQYTDQVNKSGLVSVDGKCENQVGYFEGGSLGCTKKAYFMVGGFNEDYEGYGCEDCDFFHRIKFGTNFYNIRTESFCHLWHGRTNGWKVRHNVNKEIERRANRRNKPDYINILANRLKNGRYANVYKHYRL